MQGISTLKRVVQIQPLRVNLFMWHPSQALQQLSVRIYLNMPPPKPPHKDIDNLHPDKYACPLTFLSGFVEPVVDSRQT
jgi:hypothetical protein